MKKELSKKILRIILITTIILTIIFILTIAIIIINNQNQNYQNKETFLVLEVEDGDTFLIETGEYVRLICVDAPEKNQTGYFEAKEFLKALILGKQVRLEIDKSQENTDKYSRLLRYVYFNTSKEEIFLNKELVKLGLAKPWPYGNSTEKCDEIIS